MEFGHLVVFRKGKFSAPYELGEGDHTVGSSKESNIRLKFFHPLLLDTHALIQVNNIGVATIINKSDDAPLRVNGKVARKPTILRHEDKFEIFDKVFQYFNEYLKGEPEDSEKFVIERKNILLRNRRSVNPLTPAKKSPNLKMKTPSIRKSLSSVSNSSKGLQVTITPTKRPDSHVGSKTTSKIIVSKALVSPHSARKRRLSLDNGNKPARIPKISSRNILLSKSTINITISEEHEYSEIESSTNMKPIQGDGEKDEGKKTPRKSIKLETVDTSNKDNISVDLIDLNSPRKRSSVRRASLQHQSVLETKSLVKETALKGMKTPINNRIQSLKTVRHSLKKDTPPPRITLPKVTIHPSTPQSNRVSCVSLPGDHDDISISYSPNAEPSLFNPTQKGNKTPRRSVTKKYEETVGNKSRVSFAIEAPTEASPVNLEGLNDCNYSPDEDNEFLQDKGNSQSRRKSKSGRSILNEESRTPNVQPTSRRSTKSRRDLAADDIGQDLELPKSRRSSSYSLNSTKKFDVLMQETRKSRGSKQWQHGQLLRTGSADDSCDEQDDLKRSSFKQIIISATSTDGPDAERPSSSRKSEPRSLNLSKSKAEVVTNRKSLSKSPKRAPKSRNTSLTGAKVQNESLLSENDMLAEALQDSSAEEMDELQITEIDRSNVSTRNTKLDKSARVSVSGGNVVNNSARSTRATSNGPRTSNKPNESGLNISQSTKFEESTMPPKDIDSDHNIRRSRISKNISMQRISIGSSDEEDNVNMSSKLFTNTSRRSAQIEGSADSSQVEDIATDKEENDNTSSIVSKNISKRSSKVEEPMESPQAEDSDTEKDNVNKSTRASRNLSKRSIKAEALSNSSQTDIITTDAEENINMSYGASRGNISKRSTDAGRSAGFYHTEETEDNVNRHSTVSKNISKSRSKLEASQTEDNDTEEENVNKSTRASRNLSRRSMKVAALSNSFQSEDKTTDKEDNVNKSSRVSRDASQRIRKNKKSAVLSEYDDNTTDADEADNKSSRLSRNASRRSQNFEQLSSSLSEDNSTDADESASKSTRSFKNISRIANISGIQNGSAKTPNKSSGNVSRRSTRAVNNQSSIDSAETTMEIQQKSEASNAKNRTRQSLSLFDESTQEAKPKANVSMNRSKQRVSVFVESTGVLEEVNRSKPISILDDTQEVLSPVRPLSPRKSIRNMQNQDLEGLVSSSTRVSSIRKSRTKNQTLQDSSLTSTSMEHSSSSAISVSSESFSSFKRASSRKAETHNDTEIDVVNISSMMEATEVKKSFRASDGNVKGEAVEESNASRSSNRQAKTSDMFKDLSCTSTPFHKNLSKRSRESDASGSKNNMKSSEASSSAVSVLDLTSLSSSNDCVFLNSSVDKSLCNSDVFDQSEASRRRSRRSSVSKLAGEHNCVSCRNSSVKRSRSLSSTIEPSVVAKTLPMSARPSKSPRKSTGNILEQSYEETSPVKGSSSRSSSRMTTPLLHRKSLATSLAEGTSEKVLDVEDETPKSSIKPTRRSSKANQSAYNPLLEDITPVTPEKLMVSGFTEDVFKTPINTPGLFENIRKSVIRSRKRHRESTGSTMKDSKRARVDFAQDEQMETSVEDQRKPQKSPVNRLSNFEGVKKLMKTPPKSPKNDLTNISGVKEIFSTPKDQAKSTKKDLSKVPDLRRLTSPKRKTTPQKDLPQIPELTRITSPGQQNDSKNNPRSSTSGKRLAKPQIVQKEPINDLTNISGVSTLFNVSGVEVLHQGSDIENSEDLFTKLTGKRPVKPYLRGKSLSPNKEQQQRQGKSRKTMGDIPICSPRVQQWVEDHANVMYTSAENVSEASLNEDKALIVNVSDKVKRRSKSGRSVSPKKPVQEKKDRRKTQGDLLGGSPNVAAWKTTATQAETIKAEILSPNPVLTLHSKVTKAEKVTPQQLKSKAEPLTPQQQMTPLGDSTTPASIKAGRGRPKKVAEEREKVTLQYQISTSDTPASVKAKTGRPRKEIVDQQIETSQHQKNEEESTPERQMTHLVAIATPASIKTGRGRPTKVAEEQQQVSLQTPIKESDTPASAQAKRGRPRKESTPQRQVTSLVDTITPASIKAGRGRPRKVAEEQKEGTLQNQIGESDTPASVKAKRGRLRKEIDDQQTEISQQQKSTEEKSTPHKKFSSTQQLKLATETVTPQRQMAPLVDKATPASIKAGRGRPRKVAKDQQEETLQNEISESDTPASPKAKKGRPRKEIDDLQQDTSQHQKSTEEKSSPHKQTTSLENTPASVKRGQPKKVVAKKVTSSTPNKPPIGIVTKDAPQQQLTKTPKEIENKPSEAIKRGGRSKRLLSYEELDVLSSTTASPAQQPLTKRNRTRRGKVDSQSEPIFEDIERNVASTSRTRRARKPSESELEVKKPTRGNQRRNKMVEEVTPMQDEPTIEQPLSRNRRGKKIDYNEDTILMENKGTRKLAPKGSVFMSNLEEQQVNNTENVTEVRQVKKAVPKGKRGQKMVEENQGDIVSQNQVDTTTKPVSGRRGKKTVVENDARKDVAEEIIVEAEVNKPAPKGRKGKKEEIHEEPDVKPTSGKKNKKTVEDAEEKELPLKVKGEIIPDDTEFYKRPTRGRAKRGEPEVASADVLMETVASAPKVPTRRGRRGANITEVVEERTVTEKAPAKRGKNKKLNVVKSEETDSQVPPKTGTKGKDKKIEPIKEPEEPTKKAGKTVKTEEIPEVVESPKKPATRNRGKKVIEQQTTEIQAVSQSSQKQNGRKLRNKVVEELIEMDVDSPRTARAKRGMNKKYSTDEYETTNAKGGLKRKVHFEENEKTTEVATKKSKRTRK